MRLAGWTIKSPALITSIIATCAILPRHCFYISALASFTTTTTTASSCLSNNNNMLKYIPGKKLGVSEPPPEWFGNDANPSPTPSSWTNKNWLKSRFHFSFAEYSNPRNQNFGVLRVMNDDLVQPLRGFGNHPHRDVEIATYIVEGSLTHKDSMGTQESLTRGSVQYMSAGRGVTHSEHNLSPSEPLRFIQIWINTRQRGIPPKYGSATSSLEERHNKWAHLVSDVQSSDSCPIKINQDAKIFVTQIDEGKSVQFDLQSNRQAYLLCIEGETSVTGDHGSAKLSRHDAAELVGPNKLTFTGKSHLLMVEMEKTGGGRTDL